MECQPLEQVIQMCLPLPVTQPGVGRSWLPSLLLSQRAAHPVACSATPNPCSAHSTASDPVLAFVTSHVASQPPSAQRQPSDPVISGSSGGGSSGLELRTDARLWEVQWAELTILRLLGRGSFGSVYLGEWNQVAVAVKVLICKGERGGCCACGKGPAAVTAGGACARSIDGCDVCCA